MKNKSLKYLKYLKYVKFMLEGKYFSLLITTIY